MQQYRLDRVLVAAGLAALLLGLLATLPARVAYHWFAPPELKLAGLAGSVWNGYAAEGEAAGFYFADLDWRLRPARLLAGKAAFAVSARLAGGILETHLEAGPGGDLLLRDLRAALPLAALPELAPGIEGELALNLETLAIRDGLPTSARGTARLTGLVLRPLSRQAIGDFRAAIQDTEDGISAALEDTSGMLDLVGTAALHRDRSFAVTGRVAPTAQATREVTQQLGMLGSPDEEGRREFRFEGSL